MTLHNLNIKLSVIGASILVKRLNLGREILKCQGRGERRPDSRKIWAKNVGLGSLKSMYEYSNRSHVL